jgi:hypothetical protein
LQWRHNFFLQHLLWPAHFVVHVHSPSERQRLLDENAESWYMQDSYNRDEGHFTQLKL